LAALLSEMAVTVVPVPLATGAMHLMGTLRIIAPDLAVAWPGRLAREAKEALEQRGYEVCWIPDTGEALRGMALNGVTMGERRVLLPAGNPRTQAFCEELGVSVQTVVVDELAKAAGAIGCLTGILSRATDSL
jgi:N-dimethylarginine dimethylaminohydrolase